MTSLTTLKKNGSLANQNTGSNFPSLSWFDDFTLNDIPSLFSSNFNTGISLPKVNIKEGADAFMVEMAVPGMKKSDFDIHLDNQVLSISAEIKEDQKNEDEGYSRREFGYASFKRSFTLPESVDESKINAKYNEGILTIHLPKREEAKRKPSRTIKVS